MLIAASAEEINKTRKGEITVSRHPLPFPRGVCLRIALQLRRERVRTKASVCRLHLREEGLVIQQQHPSADKDI